MCVWAHAYEHGCVCVVYCVCMCADLVTHLGSFNWILMRFLHDRPPISALFWVSTQDFCRDLLPVRTVSGTFWCGVIRVQQRAVLFLCPETGSTAFILSITTQQPTITTLFWGSVWHFTRHLLPVRGSIRTFRRDVKRVQQRKFFFIRPHTTTSLCMLMCICMGICVYVYVYMYVCMHV